MKIQCNIIRDLLPSYVDGILSPESIEAVESHLADCEECRKLYKDMAGETAMDDENNILNRLDEAKSIKAIRKKLLIRRIITIIVTAAVVTGIVLSINYLFFNKESYIPYEQTGINVTDEGTLYVNKPYYGYTGIYMGEDKNGQQIEIFFLTSSFSSRHWEKSEKERVCISNPDADGSGYMSESGEMQPFPKTEAVYYLPEKYVKKYKLTSFNNKKKSLGLDHPDYEEITDIEKNGVLIWRNNQ